MFKEMARDEFKDFMTYSKGSSRFALQGASKTLTEKPQNEILKNKETDSGQTHLPECEREINERRKNELSNPK